MKNCKLCGSDTENLFNIKFKAKPVCEDCAKAIFIQQAHFYTEEAHIPIPGNKEITGFDTMEEVSAYDKGREHEEKAILDFIKNWDGETNSVMGHLLLTKIEETRQR